MKNNLEFKVFINSYKKRANARNKLKKLVKTSMPTIFLKIGKRKNVFDLS